MKKRSRRAAAAERTARRGRPVSCLRRCSATTKAATRFLEDHPELVQRRGGVGSRPRGLRDREADPKHALGFALAAHHRRPPPRRSRSRSGESLRAEANVLFALNEHRAAVEHHDQALALFEQVGDKTQIARTLSASIQPLILLGDYERAFAAAARAREIFLAPPNPWRLARMEVNEGNIYFRLDRFAEALACYQRAYPVLVERQDGEAAAARSATWPRP